MAEEKGDWIMKHKKVSILFVASVFVAGLIYLISSGKLAMVVSQMKSLNPLYLLFALMAIVAYWMTEAKITNEIVNSTGAKQPFNKAMEVTMIGQFFNGITPFASGGQPAQLYMLTKQKLPIGKGSSVLMSKFIIYQGVLVLYSALFLIIRGPFFVGEVSNLFYIVLIGFLVNFSVIALLIYCSFAKGSNHRILKVIVGLLHKVKIVKRPEETISKLSKETADFHDHIMMMREDMRLFMRITLLSAIQLTFYFVIPYFIYRSFGMTGTDMMTLIAGTGFVLMISSFIPIPGASGGAEGGFVMILGLFFLQNYVLTAIVLWRLITYYLGVFVGGLWMVFSKTQLE